MNKADTYLYNTLKYIIERGTKDINPRPKYADGTPAYTLSFNHNIRQYDISKDEFPITSLRPIAWKSAIKEILWIYQDQSNDLKLLNEKYETKYWDEFDIGNGTIGNRYGHTVKKYNIMNRLLEGLQNNPFGRRHIIDLYQYEELYNSDGLAPCAFNCIFNVRQVENKIYLDSMLVQRSGDAILASLSGINEIQYVALQMMVAKHCGFEVGIFTHVIANEQIYDRHIEGAKELIKRYKNNFNLKRVYDGNGNVIYENYLPETHFNPQLKLNTNKTNFYDFTIDDFEMIDYNPIKPQIKFEIAI